jgi:hypothetical protein
MLKRLVERHLGELHTLIRSRWREQAAAIQDERMTAADAQAKPLDVHLFRGETADERHQRECNARYRQRHDLVHALAREGKSRSAIARLTQLDRKTVRTILSRSEYTGVPQRGQRPSPIDPFKAYIAHRMAEGCVNANQLFGELREKGFTGVYGTVWRMIRRLMRQSPALVPPSLTAAPAEAQPAIPTAFEITRWLLDKAHTLTAQQLTLVQAWVDASPDLQAGRDAARPSPPGSPRGVPSMPHAFAAALISLADLLWVAGTVLIIPQTCRAFCARKSRLHPAEGMSPQSALHFNDSAIKRSS